MNKKGLYVIIAVIVIVVFAIGIYSYMVFSKKEEVTIEKINLPEIDERQEYNSKLEAVNSREIETNNNYIPLLDIEDTEDDLDEEKNKEKEALLDSILSTQKNTSRSSPQKKVQKTAQKRSSIQAHKPNNSVDEVETEKERLGRIKARREAYAAAKTKPKVDDGAKIEIRAVFYRNQDLEVNKLVELRLINDFNYNGTLYKARNTLLFGKVTGIKNAFVNIEVSQIGTQPIKLYAYDPRMTSERGLYKEEAGIIEDEIKMRAEKQASRSIQAAGGGSVGYIVNGVQQIVDKKRRNQKRIIPVATGTEILLKNY